MAEWWITLEELDIPDGVVEGISMQDKPTLQGRLLQLDAESVSLFFHGTHMDILKRLRALLPYKNTGQVFHMHTLPTVFLAKNLFN